MFAEGKCIENSFYYNFSVLDTFFDKSKKTRTDEKLVKTFYTMKLQFKNKELLKNR